MTQQDMFDTEKKLSVEKLCMAFFCDMYKEHTQTTYRATKQCAGGIRQLAKRYGYDEVAARITRLFEDPPYSMQGFTPDVTTLVQHWNKLAAKQKKRPDPTPAEAWVAAVQYVRDGAGILHSRIENTLRRLGIYGARHNIHEYRDAFLESYKTGRRVELPVNTRMATIVDLREAAERLFSRGAVGDILPPSARSLPKQQAVSADCSPLCAEEDREND